MKEIKPSEAPAVCGGAAVTIGDLQDPIGDPLPAPIPIDIDYNPAAEPTTTFAPVGREPA